MCREKIGENILVLVAGLFAIGSFGVSLVLTVVAALNPSYF